jgi:hypothetical protein
VAPAGVCAAITAAAVLAGCASAEPGIGMAVEDFEQACFRSDRARGKLVFAKDNREVFYCDVWDTHYVFEDGILVSIEQDLPAAPE